MTASGGYQRLSSAEARRRLEAVRVLMRREGLDALIVRSTDPYLNEYVPLAESLRAWLSGFTGSVGDLLVTASAAWLFVDGRYHQQADMETDPELWSCQKLTLGEGISQAVATSLLRLARHKRGLKVGYEPERVSVSEQRKLESALADSGASLEPTRLNLVALARGPQPQPQRGELELVKQELAGSSPRSKLERLREGLREAGMDGFLVTALDELAYLFNLRGYEIDYSSTFRGLAYLGQQQALLFCDPQRVPESLSSLLGKGFHVEPEHSWQDSLERRLAQNIPERPVRVGYDPQRTSVAVAEGLRAVLGPFAQLAELESPITRMKAIKSAGELDAMCDSFERADQVVVEVIKWLNRELARGREVSEARLAAEVEARFMAAGARGLSFKVIAAAGANGAVIHYSQPDGGRLIEPGELVLLDTGAYFEAGFATDLTRTFLAGGRKASSTPRQREIYTLVLKGAVRGMKARLPRGSSGAQLDAIVRAPMWEAGYDFGHGTGHGVGILVHESPPRISTRSSSALEAGMVFSIEPGIYLPGWGGVRFENLVTLRQAEDGFLEVVPLTFAPVERALVESSLLSSDEKQWLRAYAKGREGFHSARIR